MQELDRAGMGSVRVTRKGNNVVVLEKDLATEQMVLAMGPQHLRPTAFSNLSVLPMVRLLPKQCLISAICIGVLRSVVKMLITLPLCLIPTVSTIWQV